MRKKAELPRHKTDISWMGDKKSRAEKAKFKSEATQFKEKKSPCFQICCSPHTCIPVRQPSSPLWKGQNVKDLLKKNFNLIVRLVIRPVDELASTMENLSALL